MFCIFYSNALKKTFSQIFKAVATIRRTGKIQTYKDINIYTTAIII